MESRFRILPGALTLGLLMAAGGARAAEPAPAGVVQFDVVARANVTPDRAVARFAVVREGQDVAALNAAVVAALDAAMHRARAVPGIDAHTGTVETTPHYVPVAGAAPHQDGWTVRGEVTLRSADFAALGRAAAALAQDLQIDGIGTEFSAELQRSQQDQLTARAIADFRVKAQRVAQDFGYRGYALREVTVGALQGADGGRPPLRMTAMAAAGNDAVPIEPGARTLSVSVSGSVQLQR